jgi:hypothetical protein
MSVSSTVYKVLEAKSDQSICKFLNGTEQGRYRVVDSSCNKTVKTAAEKEIRREQAYQKVFANRAVRHQVLTFLSQTDLGRCKRVKPSYNRNVTEFQRVQVSRLLPAELRGVAERATFQNLQPPAGWPPMSRLGYITHKSLSASIVVGFAGGRPFLACKVDSIYAGGMRMKDVMIVGQGLRSRDWHIYGSVVSDVFRDALPHLIRFLTEGTMTFEWSHTPSKSCCTRICDLFRKMCCVTARPTVRYPYISLPVESKKDQ